MVAVFLFASFLKFNVIDKTTQIFKCRNFRFF